MFFGGEHIGEWEFREAPRLFRTGDATQMGISRHSLFHTAKYPAVVRGVRQDPASLVMRPMPVWADDTWASTAQYLRAVVLTFPCVAAGHVTAARLYGWPLPTNQRLLPLHVVASDLNVRVRSRDVRFLRSQLFAVHQYFDLPLLRPAEAFTSLGRDLSVEDLVRIGDAAVGNWHGPPQIDLDRLRAYVSETRGIRSRRHLLDALALVRPTVDSPRETDLRLWARSVGLPEPTVHPRIFCPSIDRVVKPDLGYENEKLALEYDGDHHRTSKDQWNRDITRDEAMRLEGWTVFRVTGRTNYRQLEEKIRHHLGLS